MTFMLDHVEIADIVAFVLLFGTYAFFGPLSGWILGEDLADRMKVWRHKWTQQALWREERITDVSLIRGLMMDVAFYASTSVLLISGLAALLSAAEPASQWLSTSQPFIVVTPGQFTLRVLSLLLLALLAFFKFSWAMRLHSFSSIFLGALPEPSERSSAYSKTVAAKLANTSYLASYHFHTGLRAYYLGFAALSWFLSAWIFFPTLLIVILVMIRREFRSRAFMIAEDVMET